MPYRLFRESTRSVKGKVVKDISFLNRDPSKVIVLDVNPEHVALQPENAIVLQPWDGSSRDKGLVDMIPFLECMFHLLLILFYAKSSKRLVFSTLRTSALSFKRMLARISPLNMLKRKPRQRPRPLRNGREVILPLLPVLEADF